ncbi:MAG: hypothetical protein Phog2KO_10460 [Phototrophicaceae bacterium]
MSNWVQHTLNRASFQPKQQAAWLIVLGVIMTLTFGGISLSQIANSASTNRSIEELIDERDRLELENETLRAEIADFQTMPRLIQRAQELGYRTATAADMEHIMVDGYNPNRIEDVVELIPTDDTDDVPLYDETFSGWLQQNWDGLVNQFRAFGR